MSALPDGVPPSQGAGDTRPEILRLDHFTPCVGQVFGLTHEGGVLELLLRRADSAGTHAPAGERAGFSLEFLGPPGPLLPQRIYRLEHPGLGSLEIFLVPLGREDRGVRYEAVFG
ncbi:MAG TPA: hypothetical protein VKE73_11280 [Myxococcota bacterium]|nr:hypothetical protein [Myxococcota bacterium]